MEALLIILAVAILATLFYLIYSIRSKNSESVDLSQKLDLLDKNVQNAVLQQLTSLNKNLNEHFQTGRTELKDIQSKNLQDSQALITKLMGMVEQRMDQMGQWLGEVSKANQFMHMLFNPAAEEFAWFVW